MWLGIFCILLKYFSNKSYLMAHRDKTIMLYILNFKKGSSHVYSFIWIFNAPNVENEAACIEFIDKTINSQLPDYLNDSEFFELVKTYQVHVHSKASWKYNKNDHLFSCGRYFTEKTIITKLLGSKFSNDLKQEILTWRNTLLGQVKRYTDNNVNPSKVNVIDLTKDNFTQTLSVKEILNE